jgi:DNA-binding NarL/FixJ family response regulator
MTVRVVVGEDSYVMREGIRGILELVGGVELVAACPDGTTLRATIEETLPDVVLTDIRMPPSGTDEGIRIADDLRVSHPEIGVVVLSQHAEPIYVVTLFERGSDRRAYLLKDRLRDRGELSRAIREVANGGSVVDAHVVEMLLDARARRRDATLSWLTPRELEVLALIAEGHSNGAIANTLVITKRAVEHYVNAIFFKLDLGDGQDVSRRVKAAIMYLHKLDS